MMRLPVLILALSGCPMIGDADLLERFDQDGDGHEGVLVGGDDCDDLDPTTFGDDDGDGFYVRCAGGPDVIDCDDDDATVFPGAAEVCNERDDDCDDKVDAEDDGPALGGATWYSDVDRDGFGVAKSQVSCEDPGDDWASETGDCDDVDDAVNPLADEVCNDRDDDCDALVDDDDDDLTGAQVWHLDADADDFGDESDSGILACVQPPDSKDGAYVLDASDCDDSEDLVHPDASEGCDGVDSDCDGELPADESDIDLDTWLACSTTPDCNDKAASVYPGAIEVWYDGVDQACDGGDDYDQDKDGHKNDVDCKDTDASVFPGATDAWYDGVDKNCDGNNDFDQDKDTHANDVDCNDVDPLVHPGVAEKWYDGVDQNCDGANDYDQDGDGSKSGVDCNDTDPGSRPGAIEIWYDGVDQACNGGNDYDQDGDGVDKGLNDCNDTNDKAFKGAAEIWYDGVDNDCLGGDDYDQDKDGAKVAPGPDCNDTNAAINPAATETWYDGVDKNCDGKNDFDQDGDGDVYHATNIGPGIDCADTNAQMYTGASVTMASGWTLPQLQAVVDNKCWELDIELPAGDTAFADATLTLRQRGAVLHGQGATTVLRGLRISFAGTVSKEADTIADVVLSNTLRAVVVPANTEAVLDNVLIQSAIGGGDDEGGSAAWVLGKLTATNLEVTTSAANSSQPHAQGVLRVSGSGNLTLVDAEISSNSNMGISCKGASAAVTLRGSEIRGSNVSALYADSCAVTVEDTKIRANGGAGSGGWSAVKLVNTPNALLRWVRITENMGIGSLEASALSVRGASSAVRVENTVIGGNSGDRVAIEHLGGTLDFVNSVIVDNTSFNEVAGLSSNIAGCGVSLRNSVVMDNSSCTVGTCTVGGLSFGQPGCTHAYTNVFHNGAGNVYPPPTYPPAGITGYLNFDPLFVFFSRELHPIAWDFHLRPTSPMRNNGDPGAAYNDGAFTSGTDLRNDLGLYGGPQWKDASWYDDVDNDGLYDGWETFFGVTSPNANTDNDGLTNLEEQSLGTQPIVSDTDNDGMNDGSDPYPLYFGTP